MATLTIGSLLLSLAGVLIPMQWGAHLEPPTGAYDATQLTGYDAIVSSTLFRGQSRARLIQMVSLPALEPEMAVFIEDAADGSAAMPETLPVTCVSAKTRILSALLDRMPAQPTNGRGMNTVEWLQTVQPGLVRIPTSVARADLDRQAIEPLVSLWGIMIDNVRFTPANRGLTNPSTHHFAHFVRGRGVRSGMAESPGEASPAARLIKVGQLLCDYARVSKDARPRARGELLAQANSLLYDIKSKSSPP